MNVKYLLLLLLLLSGTLLHAQRKPRIKGNRQVTEVSNSLPEFHSIKLLDNLKITLESAAEPGYSVTADDNLIEILKFRVDSDTLFISSYYTITAKKQLDILVRYADLQSITLEDGELEIQQAINSDALAIDVRAASRCQLRATVHKLMLRMEDQSKGDFNLETDSLEIALKGRAEALIYQVSSAVNLRMGDQSDASLEGSADTLDLRMDGGSELKAERLQAAVVKARMDGTARVRIRPTDYFELASKGSANTYWYGDAKISILEFGDTSELYKRTD